MSACTPKANQTHLGTFTHTSVYSRILTPNQAYSEPCVTQSYLKLQYIQNPGVFRTLRIFITLQNICIWNFSFRSCLLYETNVISIFNTGLIFTPEVFSLCQKVWGPRRQRAGGCERLAIDKLKSKIDQQKDF